VLFWAFAVGTAFVLGLCQRANAATGTVVGSKHDLHWAYHRISDGFHSWDDLNEVCVFCHTPHHANQAQGALWNRSAPATTYTLYQSPTLDNPVGQPGKGSAVCLSCHDGSLAVDALVQRPQYGLGTITGKGGQMTTAPKGPDPARYNCGTSCHRAGGGVGHDGTNTYMGSDLSNDHPVSVQYPNSPEFTPAPFEGKFANGVRLVDGRVECITCHNPHDPTYVPFLVTPDNGSALCYTCHKK
jgi:predicted CXXCH cytochrome family protein